MIRSAFKDNWGIEGRAGIAVVLTPTLSISADGDATADEYGQQPAILEITRTGTDLLTPLGFDLETFGGTLGDDQLVGGDIEGDGAYALAEADGKLDDAGQEITFPIGQAVETLYVYPLEDHTPRWTETVDITLAGASGDEDYTLASASPGSPPNTAAGVYVVNDDAYAWLDNGSDNDIFEGGLPADGGTLVPLVLDLPEEVRNGAQITLTDNAPTEADVYTMSDPGEDDTPILGNVDGTTVSAVTWTIGVSDDAPSGLTTLYVKGISGSESFNDINFSVGDTDAGATPLTLPQYSPPSPPSPPPPTPPAPATSVTAPTASATVITLTIDSDNNPNSPPGTLQPDISGKTVNWLIGQMVDLQVHILGPTSLVHAATFNWDYPTGNVLRTYQIHSTPPLRVPLSNDDGGAWAPWHSGLTQPVLDFIWVSTSAAPPSYDADTITVHAANVPGFPSLSASTTFDVYTPSSTVTVDQGKAGVWVDSTGWNNGLGPSGAVPGGIYWTASVATPSAAGFVSGVGEFNFVQLVKQNRQYTTSGGTTIHSNFPGVWVLDNQEPYRAPNWDWFNAPGASAWLSDGGPHTTGDGPADGALPLNGAWSRDVVQDSFETFLMYLPPGGSVSSNWVPLQMEPWGFATSASFTNNHWVPTLGFFSYQNIPGFAPQSSEPFWSDVVINGSGGPKNIYP